MILLITDMKGTEIVTGVERIDAAPRGQIRFVHGPDGITEDYLRLNDCLRVELLPEDRGG
jgi:hypothetical protein